MSESDSFLPSDNKAYSRQSLRDTGDDTTGILVPGRTIVRSHRWRARHVDDSPGNPLPVALLFAAFCVGCYLTFASVLPDNRETLSQSRITQQDEGAARPVDDPPRDVSRADDRATRSHAREQARPVQTHAPASDRGPAAPTAAPAVASAQAPATTTTPGGSDAGGSEPAGPDGSQVPGVDCQPGGSEPPAGGASGSDSEPVDSDGSGNDAGEESPGADNGGSDVGAGDSGGDGESAGGGPDGEPSEDTGGPEPAGGGDTGQ